MQTILVIITILIAVAYLGYVFYRKFSRKKGDCEGCSMSKTIDTK